MNKVEREYMNDKIKKIKTRHKKELLQAVEDAKIQTYRRLTSRHPFKRWFDELWLSIEKFIKNKKYN